MTSRRINYKNQKRRDSKLKRERERKENGTYKLNKIGVSKNSKGEPFYIRERVVTAWKRVQRKNPKLNLWVNPITHQKYEDPDNQPPDHISYRLKSNY